MRYLKQFTIILLISLVGEILKAVLPLPIPASVYGLMIMLICLCTKVIRINQIKDASLFLIEIMPVMFIPAAVGLSDAWPTLKPIFIPVFITVVITTILVMVVTGRVTQFVIRRGGNNKQ